MLENYNKKRDFSKTPEPEGKNFKKANIFVIQKHNASHLHYDFRLQIGNVLKSWAIPKGPTLNPKDKRLAIETEDHPLEYAGFEGIIPEGSYGGGTVIVWDNGKYENIKPYDIKKSYDDGRIEVSLKGQKLHGNFALVRLKGQISEKSKWMFIKMRDKFANYDIDITKNRPESIITQKTIEDLEVDKLFSK